MTDTKPGTFTVIRSTVIAAPPEAIFPLIDDFHAWIDWSPWENVPGDELAKTFSGAEKGIGAAYQWAGKKTGQGRMEIVGSAPSSRIDIDLRFLKPFKAENLTEFHLTPVGGGTDVVWTMTGKTTLMSKVMGLFMNMDKMVGGSFEQGLAALKAIAER
jgi:hypothetical protein